jgi:hypothetical protein
MWPRVGTILLVILTTTLCIAVATRLQAGLILNAIVIFATSLCGFHGVAWLTYRHKRIWNTLDYALELVTITTLVAALAGIQESSRTQILQAEFAQRKAEHASFLYALKSTITNDCHPKPSRLGIWTPSPEPYLGACDRVEHFLPQIEFAFGNETGIESMTSDDSWPRNILIDEDAAVGSWKGLYTQAHKLIAGSQRTKFILEAQNADRSDIMKLLAESGKLRYWQYLLAFVLGLRLARRSVTIWQARSQPTSRFPEFLLLHALRRSNRR